MIDEFPTNEQMDIYKLTKRVASLENAFNVLEKYVVHSDRPMKVQDSIREFQMEMLEATAAMEKSLGACRREREKAVDVIFEAQKILGGKRAAKALVAFEQVVKAIEIVTKQTKKEKK